MTDEPTVPAPAALTRARTKPDLVDVPARTALAVEGEGAPADPSFAAAIGALYRAAYGIRSARKRAGRPVFKVGPLVGTWRVREGTAAAAAGVPAPGDWRWTLEICLPDDVGPEEADAAVPAGEGPRARLVRAEPGRFARILHVGPYAAEPESFARIAALLADEGLAREPWHVEVYLSDPGRTAPEKLKTALLVRVR